MTVVWRRIQAPRDETHQCSGCRTAAEGDLRWQKLASALPRAYGAPQEDYRVHARKKRKKGSASPGGEASGEVKRGAIGQQEPKVGGGRRTDPAARAWWARKRWGIARRRVGRSAPRKVRECRKGEEMTSEAQIGSKGGRGQSEEGGGGTSGSVRRQLCIAVRKELGGRHMQRGRILGRARRGRTLCRF